jgi:hypothetical protein
LKKQNLLADRGALRNTPELSAPSKQKDHEALANTRELSAPLKQCVDHGAVPNKPGGCSARWKQYVDHEALQKSRWLAGPWETKNNDPWALPNDPWLSARSKQHVDRGAQNSPWLAGQRKAKADERWALAKTPVFAAQ